MQPLKLNDSIPLSQIEGHICVCCGCGADVIPLPLDVNPNEHIVRGIVRGVSIADMRSGTRRECAILLCPACADPEEVQDYERLEMRSSHDAAAHAACVAAAESSARRAAQP